MIILLSPAKKLHQAPAKLYSESTSPFAEAKSAALVKKLKQLTTSQLSSLFKVSDQLAQLNAERYASWREADTYQALSLFAGDVYQKLNATTLSPEALERAARHLRILSGLYGVLKPADAIAPYRLEMGTQMGSRRCG